MIDFYKKTDIIKTVHKVNETGGDAMELLNLKGIALSQYGSCSEFARSMGWNRSKAERILNGKQTPSLQDIKAMVERMKIPQDIIVPLFFGTMFTK